MAEDGVLSCWRSANPNDETASSNKAAITFAATATPRAIIIGNSVLFFILTFLS